MPELFGRKSHEPFALQLQGFFAATNENDEAMARNLAHDHRVSPAREAAWLDFVRTGGYTLATAVEIRRTLRDYTDEVVRKRAIFAESALCRKNAVHLPADETLVTCLNLSGLWSLAADGVKNGWWPMPTWLTKAPHNALDDGTAWTTALTAQLSAGPRRRAEVLGDLLALVNIVGNTSRHGVWAARWRDVRRTLPAGASPAVRSIRTHVRTTARLGVQPRWPTLYVAIAYNASRATGLVRPTILDGADLSFHFPSPEQRVADSGGLTADLGRPSPARPVAEYLHRWVDFSLDDLRAAGFRVWLAPPSSAGIRTKRRRHWLYLANAYSRSAIETWMPCP